MTVGALGACRGVGWVVLLRTVPRLTLMGVDEEDSDFFLDSFLTKPTRGSRRFLEGGAIGTREAARLPMYPMSLSASLRLAWTPAGGESRRMALFTALPGKSKTAEMVGVTGRLMSTSFSGWHFSSSMA